MRMSSSSNPGATDRSRRGTPGRGGRHDRQVHRLGEKVQRVARRGIVVDDEQRRCHAHGCFSSAARTALRGQAEAERRPASGEHSAQIRPSCASMIERLIASPSPRPRPSDPVEEGPNMAAATSAEKPQPWSRTRTRRRAPERTRRHHDHALGRCHVVERDRAVADQIETTCSICTASTRTVGRCGSRSGRRARPPGGSTSCSTSRSRPSMLAAA